MMLATRMLLQEKSLHISPAVSNFYETEYATVTTLLTTILKVRKSQNDFFK